MKQIRIRHFLLISVPVLSALHLNVIAQIASPAQPANPPPTSSQPWSGYDANQDGKLDKAEREAARRDYVEQRKEQRRARAQAAAEARKAAAAAKYERLKISPALIEKYDRNKDGILEPHEWEKHRRDMKRLAAERQQGQQQSPPAAPAAPPPPPQPLGSPQSTPALPTTSAPAPQD